MVSKCATENYSEETASFILCMQQKLQETFCKQWLYIFAQITILKDLTLTKCK